MTTRRQFLSGAAAGAAMLAASPLLVRAQESGSPRLSNALSAVDRFRPSSRIGLDGIAMGSGLTLTSDEQSQATLQAAFATGVRYFDTSPCMAWVSASVASAISCAT